MSKLRFTTQAASAIAASASRAEARRLICSPLNLRASACHRSRGKQYPVDPAVPFLATELEDEPEAALKVASGRQGAPGNARERTRTSIEAIAVWVQCNIGRSGSAYCTCTIWSSSAR